MIKDKRIARCFSTLAAANAFPRGALVVMMKRGEQFFTPRGDLPLQAGDILQLQADTPEHLREAEHKLRFNTSAPRQASTCVEETES